MKKKSVLEKHGLLTPEIKANPLCLTSLVLKLDRQVEELKAAWQPIETAPKDGTEILAFRSDAGVFIAKYCAMVHFCDDQELEKVDEETQFAEDWFCSDFIAGSRLEGSEVPTHWMALPDHPDV